LQRRGTKGIQQSEDNQKAPQRGPTEEEWKKKEQQKTGIGSRGDKCSAFPLRGKQKS